ncbi:uncharacterized protein RCC_08689 [Ramularia collo-cygni]|uniref:Uncharacterized protein n=1 Tax=Ramularia collo-cygni TaxID=112498 RepID=A0A2D3VFS0_9PEZI|nr:uncharacterized protein RCC_08689 [Ramularia collo-cygni]CZT22981.1 uncharacterized protein RCC_08689 [Ramularia collo-cygni]
MSSLTTAFLVAAHNDALAAQWRAQNVLMHAYASMQGANKRGGAEGIAWARRKLDEALSTTYLADHEVAYAKRRLEEEEEEGGEE